MPSAAQRYRQDFVPGQMVPISGVYTVVHQTHREEHQVIAIRGEEFPLCRVCNDQVRFRVAQLVPHVTHDFDLAGPRLKAPKSRAKAAKNGMA
jgi:hypothetical protein